MAAETIAAGILKDVLKTLASEAFSRYDRSKGIHSELKKLETTLIKIQSLLNHASQKETTDEAVKQWLNDLQHLAYDVADVLDDLATEDMCREFDQQSGAMTSKVRKLIPTCCINLSLSERMHPKLDYITSKFEDLEKEKDRLGLINLPDERSNRIYQTSLLDKSIIVVGREKEKKELLVKLLGDEPCDKNFSIVPIVGMGGLGKTTLARLLYDDEKVKKRFEVMAWVCVSDQFDISNISKVILQSVNGENKEFADLNLLQVALRKQLRDKRFLMVLDDVWSDSYDDWQTLVSPFHACAPGSKIIMTTRKVQLLTKLGYDHLNHVQTLSHDDAVTLFAQHALGANNFDSHPVLKQYGEGIVEKCDGLPLALSVLGRLLRTKTEEEEWKELLNSEIWRLRKGDEIVPALRLSYNDLSACLKQLFAYFSLFPKNYVFNKELLILLWMAEGFLNPSSSTKSMERLGLEYLEELLSRSLLQHAPNDKSSFVMHDLLNDLATSVAGEFFSRLDIEMVPDVRKEALEKYRHMSFVCDEYIAYPKFDPFKTAKKLRTFLSLQGKDSFEKFYLSSKILVDLLPELPMLRVLSLGNSCISEVPETIGSLKHLRYLNLSENPITHLPESVGNLYNLQTLLLSGCSDLIELPNNFSKLKNLRHLGIYGTPLLNKLPLWIGQLKSLQTLTKIIVGGDNDLPITKIKDLTDFDGWIHIKGLDKVEMAMHAQEANLLQKRFKLIKLEWSDVFDVSRKESLEKEVLCGLKPNSASLTSLIIVSYGGIEFPNWVGDPSFLQLTEVNIFGCKNCTSLPPLGQLPSLKKLFIKDTDEVKAMGSELAGTGLSFPSLEVLHLENMKRLEEWSTDIGMVSFPCLKELVVRSCPNLVQVSPEALPSLNILYIDKCDSGVLRSLVQVASRVLQLEIESISGLDDVVWRGVIEYLGAVEYLTIKNCNEIRYLWESMASKALIRLMYLEVQECQNLVRLGEKEEGDSCGSNFLTTLRTLKIEKCESMEHCRCPDNIEELDISDCPSITFVSFLTTAGGQKLKDLTINGCDKLLEKELIFGGDNTRVLVNNTSMPMLQTVELYSWPNLTKIIELKQLIHLTSLAIGDCPNMESFPDHELPNLTSLTHLIIYNCPSTDASFPRGFWPPKLHTLFIGGLKKPILEWRPQNFPATLVDLGLYCSQSEEDDVSRCSQLSHLLPSSLTTLRIDRFKKLKSVSVGVQHLTSLQHLFLGGCPKMKHLPDILLPSLLSLNIFNCPKLKGRCSRRGSYWSRISHIPRIKINEE
ncbi:putative P-loop containing nucleoside triphosphate hydrolase, leucine-rich repeat domain superfamily [Helianthus annuus]|nr:putative P-loop containing nucleoside triphosphate hydrolase, leucine-rich repeat domain superfamily [Helianthus annuus]KAJ0499484.1 putative P-loop containing nucleoside triphosphate hydrolase, leucine-rich repeat domain superfamily [Helianthus annuus]KAJ0672939.1 putative P-loop containing nucleoside triphosphate hydrolase, leucine-rich repeat domain superfamily [Helianthus annuus]